VRIDLTVNRKNPMTDVIITDVTLREYGQNVSSEFLHLFTPAKRLEIARKLAEAGFKRIEIFSCINPKLAPAMEETALKEISSSLGRIEGVDFITLVPNGSGYETFKRLELGKDGFDHIMGIFFSAVESHNLTNLGRSIEKTLEEYGAIASEAVSRGTRMCAYISAAFGYSLPGSGTVVRPGTDRVSQFIDRLFDMGAGTVTLSDLQGIADVRETELFLGSVLEKRQGKDTEKIGYHPHHVSGAEALRNSKAAFDLGIRRFDASLGGTGGCITGAPGNQPTEGLAELFNRMGVEAGLDVKKVLTLADTIQMKLFNRIKIGEKPC
jgi:isopropylmalate/homocitrate/citramalate synthase